MLPLQRQDVVLIFLFMLLPSLLLGQPQVPENPPADSLSGRGIRISDNGRGSHLHLYNGTEYVNYDEYIEGYPFFESETVEKGTLVYDGSLYQNVPMLYDVVKDEVIIEHFNNYFKINLIAKKISSFSLLNHPFVRIVADSLPEPGIPTGFYEKLYDGKVKVLARRIKIMEEEIVYNQLKKRFVQNDRYYLCKDTVYVQVKGRNAILRVFRDRRKEIRKFIKENKINFKNDPGTALTRITRFYDNLYQE
jgi:hypothetical protein